MKKLLDILLSPWRKWKENREWKKRIEELRKRDPLIFN